MSSDAKNPTLEHPGIACDCSGAALGLHTKNAGHSSDQVTHAETLILALSWLIHSLDLPLTEMIGEAGDIYMP